MRKKGELKKKNIRVFINEDLTPLRSAMRRMVKEQAGVKNVTTRNGKIVAWLTEDPDRAIEINTPDDLSKVGIVTPDWKRLHMDHIVWENTAKYSMYSKYSMYVEHSLVYQKGLSHEVRQELIVTRVMSQ